MHLFSFLRFSTIQLIRSIMYRKKKKTNNYDTMEMRSATTNEQTRKVGKVSRRAILQLHKTAFRLKFKPKPFITQIARYFLLLRKMDQPAKQYTDLRKMGIFMTSRKLRLGSTLG